MADIADKADAAIEECTADALRRAAGRSGPEHDSRFDGLHCVEDTCGVTIPAARLALGKVRCVDCQVLRERLVKLRQYHE